MIEATVGELSGDPHRLLAHLRGERPVAWVEALGGWLVTSHQHARQVLRNAERFTVDDPRFSTAQLVGPSMLSLDGPEHDRHRRPFTAAFRPAALRQRIEKIIKTETSRLVNGFRHRRRAELRQELAAPLATATMMAVLELEHLNPAIFSGLYARLVIAISEMSAGQLVGEDGLAAWEALRAELTPGGTAPGRAELNRTEVVSNHAVLLFGGIDTTEGMITNAIRHVLSAPDRPAIAADADLAAAAVEESLRLEPTAARVDRYATADLDLGGCDIRRGDLVMVSLSGANRDPAVFANPDDFDPRRTNVRDHLSFVEGAHFCLGAHLARLETRCALQATLALPRVRLDPAHQARVEGLVFRKPAALHVLWDD